MMGWAMKGERGAVLINALVIVLVISAIAAALLTRAEGARVRSEAAQDGAQTGLYLDGIEGLLPTLLRAPLETSISHLGQPWARQDFVYQIDRGTVTAQVSDLQGGLNVNWLLTPDDFALESFTRLFAELGVPVSLVDAIAGFVQPGGGNQANAYLARRPPIRPKGGALQILPQLRDVEGMTPKLYQTLAPYLAALPTDVRLNLNTASKPVLRAVLAPFPSDLVAETLARRADDPMESLSAFRNRLIEILETEDIDEAYPLDRLTTGSDWFGARLTARLDGRVRVRRVVLRRVLVPEPALVHAYRWSEFD